MGPDVLHGRAYSPLPPVTQTTHAISLQPVREHPGPVLVDDSFTHGEPDMNAIIYLVGLVVVILAILSFLGMR